MTPITSGCHGSTPAMAIAEKAPNTTKSPCATLVKRITPNISDRPSANSAYRLPSSTPWSRFSIMPCLVSEVGGADLLARQRVAVAGQCDAPFLEAVQALRHALR